MRYAAGPLLVQSIPPEVLEPVRRQRRVDRGAGDRQVAKVMALGAVLSRSGCASWFPHLTYVCHIGMSAAGRIASRKSSRRYQTGSSFRTSVRMGHRRAVCISLAGKDATDWEATARGRFGV
jgi:hypothetical protein